MIVPPRSPEALAQACLTLLHDAGLRRRLGAPARTRALEYFTVDRAISAFDEIYTFVGAGLKLPTAERQRLEAAIALNRGCCCSKIIIKALVNCVSRSEEDGYPSENSERVLAAAYVALVHCLNCYTEVVPAPAKRASIFRSFSRNWDSVDIRRPRHGACRPKPYIRRR